MIIVQTALFAVIAATSLAAPLEILPNAPSAKELGGTHILLNNDLDSLTPKFPVVLLSRPRSQAEARTYCEKIGENLLDIRNNTEQLIETLDLSTVARYELNQASRFWVADPNPSNSSCAAFDRRQKKIVSLSCATSLPSFCTGSPIRTKIDSSPTNKQVRVDTSKAGAFQGYRDRDSFRFLGIPYAKPPVGDLRFMAPQPLDSPASGAVHNALKFGNACIQLDLLGNVTGNPATDESLLRAKASEDCLYLNVYTPSLKQTGLKGLPVMVYVHGGGFILHASSMGLYEAGNLVSRGGAVVVTLNYRLSVFGMFEHAPEIPRSKAPGNNPTRDQILALKWIQANIAAFGGDPNEVTIFGESAGGWSMRALLSAPSAQSLYKHVISMSDPINFPFISPKISSGVFGARFMSALNCSGTDLACIQNKSVDEVNAAQKDALFYTISQPRFNWMNPISFFIPVVDGDLIPQDFSDLVEAGRFNKKAKVLWGVVKDEMSMGIPALFPNPIPPENVTEAMDKGFGGNITHLIINSPYYQLDPSDPDTVRATISNANTDIIFRCPTLVLSQQVAAKGTSGLYVYQIDHGRSPNIMYGGDMYPFLKNRVVHADDIIPAFGSGDIMPGIPQTGDDARFSRQLIDRFTTFAKTGNPNPDKKVASVANRNPDLMSIQWPLYSPQAAVMHININSELLKNKDTDRCNWVSEKIQFDYQDHGPDDFKK
ncbi:hypothetical protein BGW38_010545 [Lunasporangiospora selenospora]|uniref:Carboxylesterase type B domain-containing protein n=1 Tax=Lunasporangiospora selenospora TaxID=979761 RepID=A0A9P6FW39_9FUNG|nr:hypothetical protein BGW38_010545 [Lunasporangiospora selenospora]